MEPRKKKILWGLILGLGIPYALLLLVGVITTAGEQREQAAANARSQQEAAERKARAEAAWAAIPPGDHLAAATKLLAGEPEEAQVKEARRHLGAIPKDSPHGRKAEALRIQADTQQARILGAKAEAKVLLLTLARASFAKDLENSYLDKGINADVTVSGPAKTNLRIKWALVSKVAAHQLDKNDQFWSNVQEMGFKKVILTDGYDESFSWTVK